MKTLNKIYLGISFSILIFNAYSQQDEQIGLYMFNPLQYNSAYAGSRGDFNATVDMRSQWIGMSGAPKSQFFSMNSPININNMSLGMSVSNDQIGARSRTSFYGDYAYTLRFKDDRKLNLGISGGGEQISVDFQKLVANDPSETDYLNTFSQFKLNAGVGAYYYSEKFYAGISVPRLFESKLMNQSVVLSDSYTKRHYYFTMGYVKTINSVIDLKSSFLVKMTENAPLTVDLNANLFFYKAFWIGAMYRYNSAIGVNIAYQIKESLTFGYSYDYPINGLNSIRNGGSHEVMLNYSINNRKKSFGSPRYF